MGSHPSRCYCCAAQSSSYDAILCLKKIFRSLPSWIAGRFYSLWPIQTSSAAQRRYTPPIRTANRTASAAAQGIGLTPMSPAQLNNSGNTTSTQATGPIYVPPMLTHKWLWIIFGIKNHPDFHAIENIEMSSLLMNDATFFRELKSLESKHRWPILKWFSPYIFSYCNFVQVFIAAPSLPGPKTRLIHELTPVVRHFQRRSGHGLWTSTPRRLRPQGSLRIRSPATRCSEPPDQETRVRDIPSHMR
jgi:hypothetical protein